VMLITSAWPSGVIEIFAWRSDWAIADRHGTLTAGEVIRRAAVTTTDELSSGCWKTLLNPRYVSSFGDIGRMIRSAVAEYRFAAVSIETSAATTVITHRATMSSQWRRSAWR